MAVAVVGLPLVAEVVDGRWRPAIGDPTVYGWATVAAYLWAALFCALCVRWAGRLYDDRGLVRGRRRYRVFWSVLCVGLAFMAVNKQLDLQGLMVVWAKGLAKEQGWYSERRAYQRQFIAAMAAGGAVLVAVMFMVMRGLLRQTWLAVLGLGVTLAFVLIRAASFHFVDRFLGVRVGGVATNWLLEWSGILLISAGALSNLLRIPPPAGPATTSPQRRPRERR